LRYLYRIETKKKIKKEKKKKEKKRKEDTFIESRTEQTSN
jgi:hypothetical protein